VDKGPGISGWFLLEVLDFYHGGLECIIGMEVALIDTETRKWSFLSDHQNKFSFPPRFSKEKVFRSVRIPWRNILHYDMSGDQHYPQPHLYCAFADSGTPYDGEGFFLAAGGRYEYELNSEDKLELENMLRLAESS
jgi:hypothetical protein